MGHVQEVADVSFEGTTLVEGLPGAGLVGKIAADHLVESFGMDHVASIHCEGLPQVAVYHGDDPSLMPPVRIYADTSRELVVLQSDVPVSPSSAEDFAGCVTAWVREHGISPIYISGLTEERDGVPEVYGVSTGDAAGRLEEAGIGAPTQGGLVSGPTGALLAEASEQNLDAVGLIAQTEARFPDPESARAVLVDGIQPLTGIEVDTDDLVERAEEIRKAKEQLAARMQEAEDESSQAQPIRGFQ